jgi:hypothetical protein
VKENFPDVEMFLLTAYQLAVEDLALKYRNVLQNSTLLHACIYVKWATQEEMADNIVKRGRQMELKVLGGKKTYPPNHDLLIKQKQMLEIANVPIYYVHKKSGERAEVLRFLNQI